MPIESSWVFPAIKCWIFPVRYVTVYQRVKPPFSYGFPMICPIKLSPESPAFSLYPRLLAEQRPAKIRPARLWPPTGRGFLAVEMEILRRKMKCNTNENWYVSKKNTEIRDMKFKWQRILTMKDRIHHILMALMLMCGSKLRRVSSRVTYCKCHP